MGKKMVILGALMAVMLAMTGCGKKNQVYFEEPQYEWKESNGDSLTVWGIYPDLERSYIQKAFSRYEELTGGGLVVEQIPKEEFEEKLCAALAGETQAPDIVFSYGGTNIEPFEPGENFYDFTDAPWVEDLTDTSVNQTVYDGKIIGLPHWEASVSGVLYNKKIFKKYKLEVPKTQDEFQEVCGVLYEKGIMPMYLPGKEISMLLYQFPMDSVVEKNSVLAGLNDRTRGYADIPEMYEIVRWYKTMADKGYFGENYLTDDWAGMNGAMDSGKYAMMLCWDTWLYTDFKGKASDFGLMPAFVGVPQEGTFEGPNLGIFMVYKGSENLEEALNFITFLADPYNYNAAFEGVYTAPVFKNQVASISTPQYLETERLVERLFHDSTAWLRVRGFSQMDAAAILDYMDDGGNMTAEDCLRQMDYLRSQRLYQ